MNRSLESCEKSLKVCTRIFKDTSYTTNHNEQELNQESKCKKLNQNENDINKTFSTDFGQIEKNSSCKEKK